MISNVSTETKSASGPKSNMAKGIATEVKICMIEKTLPIICGAVISWMNTVSTVAMIGMKNPETPITSR